eukprot:CCRYP_011732-RA/>CCRYP_011732-RA protein AED:0.03 eAED:0.03 QI:459/1/1/1/0.66/0.5/4/77/1122
MSEQYRDQIDCSQMPPQNYMSGAATSSENSASEDPSCRDNNFAINQRYRNDTNFLSSHTMDIFLTGVDASSYERQSFSSSYQQELETDGEDFGEIPRLPQDDLALQGSNFNYADDPFGLIPVEDDHEYCAELAERWVEEQIQREDLESESARGHGECEGYTYAPVCESPSKMLCNELLDQGKNGYESMPSPIKSPGDASGSLKPVTPIPLSLSSKHYESKRALVAKRPASEVSYSSSTQKPPAKRRVKNPAYAQGMSPSYSSESRIRMNNALHERLQAQMALRDALRNLEKARALVRECRARYDSAKTIVQTTAEKECDALLQEETPWNNMFHQLKKYKDATGTVNVKQVEDNKSPEMARLSAWIGKNRKDGKLNGKISGSGANGRCNLSRHMNPVPATASSEARKIEAVEKDNCLDNVAVPESTDSCADSGHEYKKNEASDCLDQNEEHDDSSVFEDLDPESILADPYKKIALDSIGFDWDPRTSRWNMMYEELKAFKAEHGTTLVPHANFGLGSWVKRQQVQFTLYRSGSKSELTEDRVRLLNDLGFVWSRRSNTWNENFQRLKRWSEEHGSCHIPDGIDDPELVALSKWVADQRVHYKRHIAEDEMNGGDISDEITTKKKSKKKVPKLCPEKINALKGIGFEFDARDAKWLQKLDVLLHYKKKHGDFFVPSNYPDDPTLSNWVASQRQQYKLYKKGSKSHMTERRLKILTEAGFPFSSKEVIQKRKEEATQQDIDVFDAKPWIEKYKDLLLHIAKNGCIDSLQKNNSLLWEWVVKQREGISCSGCDSDVGDLTDFIEKERVALMTVADTFASSRANRTNLAVLTDNSHEPPCASSNREDLSWECQFGSLAAWYIKYGTYSNKGMPPKLKKFMCKQQEQHRLLLSGAKSELTSDRIQKLNDIYFPFDKSTSRDSSGDDIAASRRNRSWEEYRVDLAISYIQKGNYDMQAIDDIELRRWAIHQKSQHKLYLAGKQSSLSYSQIQRLIDIKFISKRPKQWSWPELCGDLLAFRIQFGNFDVASASVVHTSKAKSPSPGIISTSLKNIQDLVTKLRIARDDLTQEQIMKLSSANFPWSGNDVKVGDIMPDHQDAISEGQAISSKPLTKQIFGIVVEMIPKAMQ